MKRSPIRVLVLGLFLVMATGCSSSFWSGGYGRSSSSCYTYRTVYKCPKCGFTSNSPGNCPNCVTYTTVYRCATCGYSSNTPGSCPRCVTYRCTKCGYTSNSPGSCPTCVTYVTVK